MFSTRFLERRMTDYIRAPRTNCFAHSYTVSLHIYGIYIYYFFWNLKKNSRNIGCVPWRAHSKLLKQKVIAFRFELCVDFDLIRFVQWRFIFGIDRVRDSFGFSTILFKSKKVFDSYIVKKKQNKRILIFDCLPPKDLRNYKHIFFYWNI